jgi:uncharacterized protein with GYD domain
MATYVVLANWTDQGVRGFKDTLDRVRSISDSLERFGASMTSIYWTVGPYDLVATFEAPDDETMTAVALAISGQGNVRTTTLRAFNRDEMTSIIGKVG